MTGENYVSTAAAAEAVGVERSTLSRWAKRGYVEPAQKTLGGHMRWDVDKLREQVQALLSQESDG